MDIFPSPAFLRSFGRKKERGGQKLSPLSYFFNKIWKGEWKMYREWYYVPEVDLRRITEIKEKVWNQKMSIGKILLPARRTDFESEDEYYEFLLRQEQERRKLAKRVLKKLLRTTWKITWFLVKITIKLAFIAVMAIFSRKAAKFALTRFFVRMV
ncbi:hypothetical protein [Neomoorella humiferrea]|uniref:hypothetical protein n=1 Tax=Neomoorella humiferrea TaxID=676965 RepID=UPI0030CA7D70